MNRAQLLLGDDREKYRKRLNRKIKYKDFNSEYFFSNDSCRIIGVYDWCFRHIIGCVFFDPCDEEVGIAVISQVKGTHMGDYVLHHGLTWILRYYPEAQIHAQCNPYSHDLFDRAGFIQDICGEHYFNA